MRRRTGLVVALLLAMTATGCGGGDGVATAGDAEASSSAGLTDGERALRFARCMRENGVPDFPDPKIGDDGGIGISIPNGTDRATADAAMEKCKEHLPNGGEPTKLDPEMLEKLRRYAQCMRQNGVPKFPDPNDGGLQINNEKLGMSPEDPRFKAAEKKCAKLLPPPREGDEPGLSTGGGE